MIERIPIARAKTNILLPSAALITVFVAGSIFGVPSAFVTAVKITIGAIRETTAPPTPEPIERNVERSVLPLGSSVITDANEPNGIFIPVYIIP